MKKIAILSLAVFSLALFNSCKDDKNISVGHMQTPGSASGGSYGQSNAAIGGSNSSYKTYQGRPYMGQEGQPSSSGERNYNYYRGLAE